MKTSIFLLLAVIVAGSQLLTTAPTDETKRNLRENNTGPHDQETRPSLLDFFVPLTSFPGPIPSQTPADSSSETSGTLGRQASRDGRTIADYICAKENEMVLGLFCNLTRASPEIYLLLNGNITLDEYYALITISNSTNSTSDRTYNSTLEDPDLISSSLFGVLPRPSNRRLQDSQFTVFPVDNRGVQELTRRNLNEMYDAGDPVVETYFRGSGADITNDEEKVNEFIYGPSGRLVRDEFIATTIAVDEFDLNGLDCRSEISMLSNQKTSTQCNRRRWLQTSSSKSVGGAMNAEGEQPMITKPDIYVGNGVLHIVDRVIEPETNNDMLLDNVDYLVEGGDFDREVLEELSILTGRSFDSTFPPTSTPIQNEDVSNRTTQGPAPTPSPTRTPTSSPTPSPTSSPTPKPTSAPTTPPSPSPTLAPTTSSPSLSPTKTLSQLPSAIPTLAPTPSPTSSPSLSPTPAPFSSPPFPTNISTTETPSVSPTSAPTETLSPRNSVTLSPTETPSASPSSTPTIAPSSPPTETPSVSPTLTPSSPPSLSPSRASSSSPTETPSASPTLTPSSSPSLSPSRASSSSPTETPSVSPTSAPSSSPSLSPSRASSSSPTETPSATPTLTPSSPPSLSPSRASSSSPTETPSAPPTSAPSSSPSLSPGRASSSSPTGTPSAPPTSAPSSSPSLSPSRTLSSSPTGTPSAPPTSAPSSSPSLSPSRTSSSSPTETPSAPPTSAPSTSPTLSPTGTPSASPTSTPSTSSPTGTPSASPTSSPTRAPSRSPTKSPTSSPSVAPTPVPTATPSAFPTTNCSNVDGEVTVLIFTGTCSGLQIQTPDVIEFICENESAIESCPAICNPICRGSD